MKALFLCLISVAWILSLKSEEEFLPEPNPLSDPSIAVANLEGEPDCLVHGCVHVISGEFLDFETDINIPGAEPILLQRHYSSSDNRLNKPWRAWKFNHDIFMSNGEGYNSFQKRDCTFTDSFGGSFLFKEVAPNSTGTYKIKDSFFKRRITNITAMTEGGRFHHKHTKLTLSEKGQKQKIKKGDGRTYTFEPFRDGRTSYVETIKKPNGNSLKYSYDGSHQLKKIEILDSNNQNIGLLSFRWEHDGHTFAEMTAEAASQKVKYKFARKRYYECEEYETLGKAGHCSKREAWMLTEISGSNIPKVTYKYDFVPDERTDTHPRLKQKKWENGRFLKIKYYELENNTVWPGHDVYVHSARRGRVMNLVTPAGARGEAVLLYRFLYNLNHKKEKGSLILWGRTEVLDPYGRVTRYYSNETQRLVKIKRYTGNYQNKKIYSTENFFWGKKGTISACNMTAKVICLGKDQAVSCKNYHYDDRGNICKEILSGNLTGTNQTSLCIDAEGNAVQNGVDQLTLVHGYTDKKNLLCFENCAKADHDIHYEYAQGTDQISARYIESGGIKQREFFQYDQTGALALYICDDGTERGMENLSNVTERRIKRIINDKRGLPKITSELYLDLVKSVECLLRETKNSYTKDGKLSKQEIFDCGQNLAYKITWEYNSLGQVTKENFAEEQFIYKDYDANGNLTLELGPRPGQRRVYEYDRMNRLIHEEIQHEKGKLSTSCRYDFLGNKTSATDIYGNTTSYRYDDFGRLIEITHPAVRHEKGNFQQPVELRSYDIFGNAISIIDSRGHQTGAKYTLYGKPYEIDYPDGSKEGFEYTLKGQLIKATHRNGSYTCWKYDYLSRPVKKETFSAEGILLAVQTREYNAFHLLAETDESGLTTYYTYNFAGQLIRKKQGEHLEEYGYDSMGRQNEIKEYYGEGSADHILTLKKYDKLDRIIEEIVKDGFDQIKSWMSYRYDEAGNRIETGIHHEEGISLERTRYNFFNEPVEVVGFYGEKTIIQYDYLGSNRIMQKIDPKGIQETTSYDSLGRIEKVVKRNPFGMVLKESEYWHDLAGNKKIHLEIVYGDASPREVITEWEYDSLNRITRQIEGAKTAEQKSTRYFYNNAGQLEKVQRNDGSEVVSEYDPLGRLALYKTSDDSICYFYNYDAASNPLEVKNMKTEKKTVRTYDLNGRMKSEILENGTEIRFNYDRMDRPIEVCLPDKSQIKYLYCGVHLKEIVRYDKNGAQTYSHAYEAYDQRGLIRSSRLAGEAGYLSYRYDRGGKVSQIVSSRWKETIEQRDEIGNLISKTIEDPLGNTTHEYCYDDLNQLIEEKGVFHHTYHNDSLYNQLRKDEIPYKINSLNQVLEAKDTGYQYDSRGNRILKKENDQIVEYQYDGIDRLIAVIHDRQKIVYEYDAFNRRTGKTFYEFEQDRWEKKDREDYLYLRNSEIGTCCEHGEISQVRILGKGLGAEFGAAVAMEFGGDVYIPIHDHQGNLSFLMNLNGEAVEIYKSGAFGDEVIYNGEGLEIDQAINPWRFCGKRIDVETGFVYFGVRYYDPETAKWISADPLGFEGGPNLYAYILNNPFAYADLEGLYVTNLTVKAFVCYLSYVTKDPDYLYFDAKAKINPAGEDGVRNDKQFKRSIYNSGTSFSCTVGPRGIETGERHGISFGNGVNNKPREAIDSARYISELLGGRSVRLIYNPTISLVKDCQRCLLCMDHGYLTDAMENCRKEWIKSLEHVKYHIHICHSENTTVTRNALKTMPPHLRERIFVLAVCPSSYIDRSLCGDVYHISTKRDFIDLLDYQGRKTAKNQNAHTEIDSLSIAKLHDHSFQSPSLRHELADQVRNFIDYGRFNLKKVR